MQTTIETTTKGQTSDLAKIEEQKEQKIEPILKPFILKTPDGTISDAGQSEIEYQLACGVEPGTYHALPENFEWVWATNRGTLPKRIQSYYYKEHGVKLPVHLIATLGNVGRTHSSESKVIVLKFTDSVDWQDGDFGDGGSCFWGEKSGAKEMIEKNGWALCAYKVRPNSEIDESAPIDWRQWRGYARCWIADVGNRLIVFNGYGENTLNFARFLALKFSCSYRRIDLYNQGQDDGVLWINGGTGFVVGAHANIEGFTKHDLGWPEIREASYYCEVCEERLSEDDYVNAYGATGREIIACEGCVISCDRCGSNFAYQLKCFDDGKYCEDCRSAEIADALEEAKTELERAEGRVEDAEAELEEAKVERDNAQAKVEDLESEVEA